MTRQSLLAAAAVGIAGLALGVGMLPAQATTSTTSGPSIHVVAPCQGGPGTTTLTARKAGSGMTARSGVSGVTHATWYGGAYVGNSAAPQMSQYTAANGTVTASTTSKLAWPHLAEGIFVSGDESTMCLAGGVVTSSRVEAAGIQTDLVVRRDTKVVKVQGEDLPAGTWNLVVKIWTPAGFQRQTTTVTVATKGTFPQTAFRGFKQVGVFTKAQVIATTRNGKHTAGVTVSRTA